MLQRARLRSYNFVIMIPLLPPFPSFFWRRERSLVVRFCVQTLSAIGPLITFVVLTDTPSALARNSDSEAGEGAMVFGR